MLGDLPWSASPDDTIWLLLPKRLQGRAFRFFVQLIVAHHHSSSELKLRTEDT